jgi:hypothetical protein
MDIELIKELSNLGGLFLGLLGAGYYIKWLSQQHRDERQQLLEHDRENDNALRALFEKTHTEYMNSQTRLNETLGAINVTISELRNEIKFHADRSK